MIEKIKVFRDGMRIHVEKSTSHNLYNGKVILFINGLYDSIENSSVNNRKLANSLTNIGYVVYNFDYTCGSFKKGKSEGSIELSNKYEMLKDIIAVFKYINTHEDSPINLMAHSSGCLLALELAEKYPQSVSKMIWIAPVLKNIPNVLKYMFKRSPNFTKINFTQDEKLAFIKSFEYNSILISNYKNDILFLIPEYEIENRKREMKFLSKQHGYVIKYLKGYNHLLKDKNNQQLNELFKMILNAI